jgi:hypothetical protein
MVAAAPLIGLALTAGGAAMQYSAASAANKAQQRATQQWMQYQKQKGRVQNAKDEANRAKAQAAQQGTAKTLGQSGEAVDAETQRLAMDLNADNTMAAAPEATVNDQLLAGQENDSSFKNYAARRLNEAAQEARARTKALAGMQAATGSQYGFQNRTGQALAEGNQMIDLYNNYRKGDLATYGLVKGIQPLQVGAPSSIGSSLAELGGSMMSMGGGGGLSGMF